MFHRFCGRILLLAPTMVLSLLEPASAQTPEEVDEQRRVDCRLAVQLLTSGGSAEKTSWALGRIPACRPEGGAALAGVIRSARASSDTMWLQQITRVALYLHDSTVVQVSLDIAADSAASPLARVFAFRTLINHAEPTVWFYGPSEVASPVINGIRGCSPILMGHGLANELELPATVSAAIVDVARRTAADSAAPDEVRTAAYCAAFYVGDRW